MVSLLFLVGGICKGRYRRLFECLEPHPDFSVQYSLTAAIFPGHFTLLIARLRLHLFGWLLGDRPEDASLLAVRGYPPASTLKGKQFVARRPSDTT
jgi:hypothetical protein